MKIEIELSELENLKEKIISLEIQNKKLEEKTKSSSEDELIKKAVRLSYKLFDNYMFAVFKKLGFGEWHKNSVIIHDNLEHWIGKDWYFTTERINIEIGAEITNIFKRAFLAISIITEEVEDQNHKLD